MKRESRFETSNDYQLPPGDLWWHLSFLDERLMTSPDIKGYLHTKNTVNVLFHDNERAQTWFQAKQRAEIMVREYFHGIPNIPVFTVVLWIPD